MTPQWKVTLGEDADGTKIVEFSFEGERGHIQMDAGEVDPGDLDDALADQLRRRVKSCIISWKDDIGFDMAVEVRVVAGTILVYKQNGIFLALGEKVQGGIGDQDGEWLINYVRSLV